MEEKGFKDSKQSVLDGFLDAKCGLKGEDSVGVEEVRLKVEDTKQRDVGRGIARLAQRAIQKLGMSVGDAVEIVGKRTTSAIAWPAYSEDQDREIIRIDGFTRKNAGVTINEYVILRPGKAKDAINVVLAPVDMRINVDEDFTNFVKNRLMERTFVEGDTTLVMMLGQAIPFTIVDTNPKGIVKLIHDTKLKILAEPPEELREPSPKERERKKLQRFAWLKAMERKCASDYVKFCIPEENLEADAEGVVIFRAKNMAKDKNVSVIVSIQLYEKRGKIGSFKWAKVSPDEIVEYIYPENLLMICPFCGEPLTSYYGRYYCHRCSRYIP